MNEVGIVKSIEDIKTITNLLKEHGGEIYRDIWVLGVNTGLRISDLLSIKTGDLTPDALTVKILKLRHNCHYRVSLNRPAQEVVKARQQAYPDDIYLFQAQSNRAPTNKPINRSVVARKFKEIGEMVNIPLGPHSMRKTFVYQMYKAGAPIETIKKLMNQKSSTATLHYLGMTKQDVLDDYTDFEL
ncbi:MAG: tyrosine-type recombinase/integrase [Marinobacter sp.]|uniref:tyrosine-type recombinase/integrase n=1 Tax=Marinobacter sp. TaxID=50741 RepID=UPI003297EDFC